MTVFVSPFDDENQMMKLFADKIVSPSWRDLAI
jgi:hypothetical protein